MAARVRATFARATIVAALALAAATTGCGGRGTPTGALLISVDNVAPDRLGCYGSPDARTPLWDRMARRGAMFHAAYSSSPRTLPATATLLSGVHPFTHGLRGGRDDAFAPPGLTLAEVLSGAGARCGAVTSSAAFDAGTDIARGFEHFEGPQDPERAERSAESACEAARRWMAGLEAGDAFFLFLHLSDPAPPHRAEPPWGRLFADPYDAEIAVADRALTRLFLELGVMGKLDRTVVVATSPHGPGRHASGDVERVAAPGLSDSFLRVPLVAWGPLPFRGGRLRRDPALLVDVLPTVLTAFRIGPDWRLPGRSLESSELDDPVEPYAEAPVTGGEPVAALRGREWILTSGLDPAAARPTRDRSQPPPKEAR
jgi:arylsulfatase A-like enzyme